MLGIISVLACAGVLMFGMDKLSKIMKERIDTRDRQVRPNNIEDVKPTLSKEEMKDKEIEELKEHIEFLGSKLKKARKDLRECRQELRETHETIDKYSLGNVKGYMTYKGLLKDFNKWIECKDY